MSNGNSLRIDGNSALPQAPMDVPASEDGEGQFRRMAVKGGTLTASPAPRRQREAELSVRESAEEDFDVLESSSEVERINRWAEILDIEIPPQFAGDNTLQSTSRGYFFSSDMDLGSPFLVDRTLAFSGFEKVLKGKDHFLNFGQSGHGINSWNFDITYVNDKFGYSFTVPFGGAFTDDRAGSRAITNAFASLDRFIGGNAMDSSERYFIRHNGETGEIECFKVDRATNEWLSIEGNLGFQ